MHLDVLVISGDHVIRKQRGGCYAASDEAIVIGTDAATIQAWDNIVQDMLLGSLISAASQPVAGNISAACQLSRNRCEAAQLMQNFITPEMSNFEPHFISSEIVPETPTFGRSETVTETCHFSANFRRPSLSSF